MHVFEKCFFGQNLNWYPREILRESETTPLCWIKMYAQDQNGEEMTLQKFKMWSESSLKNFLSLRNKSTDGDLKTLIYR